MTETRMVRYRGGLRELAALEAALRAEGVRVSYDRPQERRDSGMVTTIVLTLACQGAYDAIKAGVQKFVQRYDGRANVEIQAEKPRPKHLKN